MFIIGWIHNIIFIYFFQPFFITFIFRFCYRIITLNDEQSILTVSTYLSGEYGHKDIYVGVPAIITSKGVREILELPLNEEDQAKFDNSCKIIKETIDGLNI